MKRTLFIILIAAMALAACATSRTSQPTSLEQPGPVNSYLPFAGGAPAATQAPAAPPSDMAKSAEAAANGQAAAVNRLVIKNAQLSIVVADVNARVKAIESMAEGMGGFVVSSNVYQTYISSGAQVPEATIEVRVPADQLNTALEQIKANVVDVQNETVTGQDVTDKYVDLQSQLTAKQAAETQLLKIMQNADKTEDVLAVYAQLQQVQSNIEVLKGQIKYYEQSAALSAISVTIVAEATIQPIEIGGWKPQGVARDALQDLVRFLQGFVDFLIRFFLRDLWELLLIALPFYVVFLIARAIFRRVRRNKKPAQTPPAE